MEILHYHTTILYRNVMSSKAIFLETYNGVTSIIIREKLRCVYNSLKALSHEAIFLATCNANLGEKDIAGSCRIVDICKLLYDLQLDYFAN